MLFQSYFGSRMSSSVLKSDQVEKTTGMMNKENKLSLEFGGIDTTLVLFFLALEFGRGANVLSIDGALMGITLIMVIVLPYFLPSTLERPLFSSWLLGRGILAAAAFVLGLGIGTMSGTVLPAGVALLPMAFLIIAAIISCYVQFYSVMKLRQAN
jgi:hypothetical protein